MSLRRPSSFYSEGWSRTNVAIFVIVDQFLVVAETPSHPHGL